MWVYYMTEEKRDFESMLSKTLDFQRLGFLESNIHPINEDETYIFSEYKRLAETDIPELGLTIARIKSRNEVYINIESDSFSKRYKFRSEAIPLEKVISTLENYIKNLRNGHKYELEL